MNPEQVLKSIVPEHQKDVMDRVVNSAINKHKNLLKILNHKKDMQETYLRVCEKFPHMKDSESYLKDIKSAKYWLEKHEQEFAECLI